MKLLARIFGWLHRAATAAGVLGIGSAFRVFVLARFGGGEQVLRLPGGHRFHFRPANDRGVVSHFYSLGYRIQDTPDEPIRTILDGGANIGDETTRFLLHHPTAEVTAVEPEGSNFELLRKNVDHLDRTLCVHGGLWPVKTHLEVIPGNSQEGFRVVETTKTDGPVAAFTIPELMERRGWDSIDVLKLDIEGSEFELFSRGTEDWLDRVKVLIFEVPDNDRPGSTQKIYEALGERRFDTFHCGEDLVLIRSDSPWKLRKVVGLEHR